MTEYFDFLKRKIKLAESYGFPYEKDSIHPMLKPHQKDAVKWAVEGGRRAVFASFGLGKTFMQLEIAKAVTEYSGKPFLIGLPLGVKQEFQLDALKLGYVISYVRNMTEVREQIAQRGEVAIFVTNYERIREGNFEAEYFSGVSFDEASVLRSLDTQTTDYILKNFTQIPYRFVCTATPSPNEYTEILNYAHFLGIMDRGQALTRFFQRDSTKAGNLTLFPHKEKEFWLWVSSWALFITKPSDLGYDDTGYDLPPLKVHYHEVSLSERALSKDRRTGSVELYSNPASSLAEAAKEKRWSIPVRVEKMLQLIDGDNWLIWHHLEDERLAIEKALPTCKTVYGKQSMEDKEKLLIDFGAGEFQYLATKPEIAGQGCNFQRYCHKAIFLGIDYKFNDFIQAVHRIYRFLQTEEVEIHIIHTDQERPILQALLDKWTRHNEMVAHMTSIIKKFGLTHHSMQQDLSRTIGVERLEVKGKYFTAVRNDNVLELSQMASNSIHLNVSSIPFSDQYEYCESYHDMGHNDGDEAFFEQLDFSTKELFRVMMPGRISCIHVKDRIRYSYQNGVGFTSLSDFSGRAIMHFEKHGFHLMGKITVPTDVVQENNQTYRLGWSEQCKDGTKMGTGLPEYVLIFRKPPTDPSNAYADLPVTKSKSEYTRARWQLDAHAIWESDGKKFLTPEQIRSLDMEQIMSYWKRYALSVPYNYEKHVRFCEELDKTGKLSARFMVLPPLDRSEHIMHGVSRMHTLNSKQAGKKKEKHVCPLQFDIVKRLITRFSNKGEAVLDHFGGLMTVPYCAIELGREGYGIELNEQYFADGVLYLKEMESRKNSASLIDLLTQKESA